MVKDIIFKYVRDDEEEFVVDGNSYFITGIEGLDFTEWEIYSKPLAFRDGSVITGSYASGKTITLDFMAKSTADSVREAVRRFFNAKRSFKVYITYKGITRWIEGKIDGFSLPTETNYHYTSCKVAIFSESAFLMSVENSKQDISSITAMWGFPFIATDSYSPVFSRFSFGDYVWFPNNGDVDTTFKATLRFIGTATNPAIYQGYRDQGVVFKLDGTFDKGDTVIIDFEHATCTKNGVNCWELVNPASKLLSIPMGGAYISTQCDTGEGNMFCQIEFYNRFMGL